MHSAGGATFGLHFLNDRDLTPDVLQSHGAPCISQFRHWRGRRNRKDRADLINSVSDMHRSRVAIHHRCFSLYVLKPLSFAV